MTRELNIFSRRLGFSGLLGSRGEDKVIVNLLVPGKCKPHRLTCNNAILRSLSEEDLNWLMQHLERVPLQKRSGVQFSNSSMNHVYFIESGLISVLADTGSGKSVETRMIGREGVVGIRIVLGKRQSCHRRIVKVSGSALRIEADRFVDLLNKNKNLQEVMLGYVHTVILQASQLSACNAHHAVQQRMARWLLLAQDKCGVAALPLTQKMLSLSLGVRRATISDCVAELEVLGAIVCSRSLINIVDRSKLEAASCKCYRLISDSGKSEAPL